MCTYSAAYQPCCFFIQTKNQSLLCCSCQPNSLRHVYPVSRNKNPFFVSNLIPDTGENPIFTSIQPRYPYQYRPEHFPFYPLYSHFFYLPYYHLLRAGIRTNLTGFTTDPVLLPNASAKGTFVIIRQHTVQLLRNFDQFSQALTNYLNAVTLVKTIKAGGHFNDVTSSMSVNGIRIVLQ